METASAARKVPGSSLGHSRFSLVKIKKLIRVMNESKQNAEACNIITLACVTVIILMCFVLKAFQPNWHMVTILKSTRQKSKPYVNQTYQTGLFQNIANQSPT